MKRLQPVTTDWKPDRASKIPLYRQIVVFIHSKVSKGEWPIGTRLPSQRALANMFSVNRSTIAFALDELKSYGIIEGRCGGGTVVSSNTWSLMLSPDWSRYVSSGFFMANNPIIQSINDLEFDPGLIRLGTGEIDPRLFPSELWEKVMSRLSSSVRSLGYVQPLGLDGLRAALSSRMRSQGIDVPPSGILITSGSLQALQLISACLLKLGSTVFTEAPTYLKSLRVFQSAGIRLSGIPMDSDGMSSSALKSRLDVVSGDCPILYTIPTNHNPTGITMSESRRHDIIKICTERRIPIIEDGAYNELYFGHHQSMPLKAADKNGMVIYLGSASKSLAPGLRIGWIAAPEPIVQRLGDVKMQTDYGASSVSQLIFSEFITSGFYDEYISFLKDELKKRRDSALNVLDRYYSGIADWNRPEGGFYIWVTFKNGISTDRLFHEAAKSGILLNPGDIYDFGSNNSLRLSYSYTTCDEFKSAAIRLADIIKRQ